MSLRIHMKGEYFPNKTEIRQRIIESKSKWLCKYCDFIELYHTYLFQIASTMGFDLIRLRFQEFTIIVHRPNTSTWIFDFKPNFK